jgi:hypothetical protein
VPQFTGLVIGTFVLPISIAFVFIFAIQSSKNEWGGINGCGKITTYTLLTMLSFVGVIYSFKMCSNIIVCGVFCFGDSALNGERNEGAIQAIGLIYFLVSITYFFLFTYLTLSNYINRNFVSICNSSDVYQDKESLPLLLSNREAQYSNNRDKHSQTIVRSKRNENVLMMLIFLLFYPFLIFACTTLPTWWAYFSRYDIQTYQV